MKKIFVFCLSITFTSCFFLNTDDDIDSFSSDYEAVVMDRETFESSTELLSNQPSEKSGKIYIKDNYLIVNEPNKGFHFYNNSNPENPEKIGFLKVLGSTDLSIKNDVIYANNAVDLIAIKIKPNLDGIEVTKRIKNIFPEKISPDGYLHNTENNEVVLNWILKTN